MVMTEEKKKVKLKVKKKGEEVPSAAAAPTPTPATTLPKITLKGVKIHIEEVNLAKKKR
jgi:hypothetical protein